MHDLDRRITSNKGTIIRFMSINNAAMKAVANLNANTTLRSSA